MVTLILVVAWWAVPIAFVAWLEWREAGQRLARIRAEQDLMRLVNATREPRHRQVPAFTPEERIHLDLWDQETSQ